MNRKKIYSRISDKLITFVEEITTEMYETEFGVFSDGINLIDNIANCEDDIQSMYCITKDGSYYNMEDFYSDYRMYDNKDAFFTIVEELIANRDEDEA